jgi:hypothetical protein
MAAGAHISFLSSNNKEEEVVDLTCFSLITLDTTDTIGQTSVPTTKLSKM